MDKLEKCAMRFEMRFSGSQNHCFAFESASSFRHESASSCVSTWSDGSWTYLTTEPRMKQFFTETMCGKRSGSDTVMSVSFMLRYWSTECSVPQMLRSFLSSMTTSLPTSDLKKEKKSII